MAYLNEGENATHEQWAAYTSRIQACALISDEKVRIKKSLFFGSTPTMEKCWWKLKEYESEIYLKIITGKIDIVYFDDFVKQWNERGGELITKEVRAQLK